MLRQPLDGEPGSLGSAARVSLLTWIGPLSDQDNGRGHPPGLRAVAAIDQFEQSHEVGASFGDAVACLNSFSRRPLRSNASGSCRPFRQWRGPRQRDPLFSASC
jgi:hypothetical protein